MLDNFSDQPITFYDGGEDEVDSFLFKHMIGTSGGIYIRQQIGIILEIQTGKVMLQRIDDRSGQSLFPPILGQCSSWILDV
jgi:hypothetical protein